MANVETEDKDVAEEHTFLLQDIERALKRAEKAKFLEAQKEFAAEAYPLIHAMAEHYGERLSRLEQAMDALIDETDSIIQGDLADQIIETLEIGTNLAEAVMKLEAGKPIDEVSMQNLAGLAAAYIAAADVTAEAVEGHQVGPEEPEGPDDEDGDEDDAETEDEDEDETDEDETTPEDQDTPRPPAAKGE
jgi:hypothetical protein